jgi:hypothetical protein
MRKKTQLILILTGVAIMVFGCTRWLTIKDLIDKHQSIVNSVYKKYSFEKKAFISAGDVSKMVAEIRVRIYNTKGTYQWIEGLIVSEAISASFFLIALYVTYKGNRRD